MEERIRTGKKAMVEVLVNWNLKIFFFSKGLTNNRIEYSGETFEKRMKEKMV